MDRALNGSSAAAFRTLKATCGLGLTAILLFSLQGSTWIACFAIAGCGFALAAAAFILGRLGGFLFGASPTLN